MREDDAQTPSGDQGQALRAKQSSVDTMRGLGTEEVPWGGEGEPGPEHQWVLQSTEESLRLSHPKQMLWAQELPEGRAVSPRSDWGPVRTGLCLPLTLGLSEFFFLIIPEVSRTGTRNQG